MPRQIISTPDAPEYSGYSQAVKVGDTIYVAGTVGVDVATGELAGPSAREQARQSLRHCALSLRAGGGGGGGHRVRVWVRSGGRGGGAGGGGVPGGGFRHFLSRRPAAAVCQP